MAFWSSNFLAKRRQQWLNAIVKFQFLVDSAWYDATINVKRINGNNVEFIVSLPRTSSNKQTIKAVRVIDVSGQQAGYREVKIERDASQGVLLKFEFEIYEKEDES